MLKCKTVLPAAVVAATIALAAFNAHAADGTWNQTAGGTYDWNVNGNWDPVASSFPNSATDDANLNNNIAGNQTVVLKQNIEVDLLNIGDLDASHQFTIAPGGAFSLSTNGPITVTAGSTNLISANMVLSGITVWNDGDAASTLEVSGVISGTTLRHNGAGTLILTNANLHTVATRTAGGGTILLGNDSALGASVLEFISGAIGSTSSQTRTIANATSVLGAANFVGAGDLDFTNSIAGATLTQARPFNVFNNLTSMATPFDGAGAITKGQAGTLLLTGNSSYTGGNTVNDGTLIVGHANALGTTAGDTNVTNAATLGLQGGITIAEPLQIRGAGATGRAGALDNISGQNTLTGQVTINIDATIGATAGSLTLSGGIIGNGNRPLTFNGAGDINVTSTIGSGVVGSDITTITKNGAGTLTLAVANNNTNTVIVNQGTLLANNTTGGSATGIGAVAVNDGGVLGGTGTITPTGSNGITVADGAIIVPGASIGTGMLTLNLGSTNGKVNMLSGAEFKFELGTAGTFATPGASDRLAIAGAVADDVVFNNNVVNFTGGGLGTYKLFDSDRDNSTQAGDTWSGLIYNETTGLVDSGLVASGAVGNFFVGTVSNGGDAGDIYFTVVPEPSTFVMLLSGFGMLLGFQRARRRK